MDDKELAEARAPGTPFDAGLDWGRMISEEVTKSTAFARAKLLEDGVDPLPYINNFWAGLMTGVSLGITQDLGVDRASQFFAGVAKGAQRVADEANAAGGLDKAIAMHEAKKAGVH